MKTWTCRNMYLSRSLGESISVKMSETIQLFLDWIIHREMCFCLTPILSILKQQGVHFFRIVTEKSTSQFSQCKWNRKSEKSWNKKTLFWKVGSARSSTLKLKKDVFQLHAQRRKVVAIKSLSQLKKMEIEEENSYQFIKTLEDVSESESNEISKSNDDFLKCNVF